MVDASSSSSSSSSSYFYSSSSFSPHTSCFVSCSTTFRQYKHLESKSQLPFTAKPFLVDAIAMSNPCMCHLSSKLSIRPISVAYYQLWLVAHIFDSSTCHFKCERWDTTIKNWVQLHSIESKRTEIDGSLDQTCLVLKTGTLVCVCILYGMEYYQDIHFKCQNRHKPVHLDSRRWTPILHHIYLVDVHNPLSVLLSCWVVLLFLFSSCVNIKTVHSLLLSLFSA